MVLNHFQQPQNMGTIEDADAIGQEGFPGEGPYMTMYLRLDDGAIAEAKFETYGCPAAMACGSWLTTWLVGRTVEQAGVIESNELMLMIGGLPLGKEHCAGLAVKSLRSALKTMNTEAH